MRKSAVFLVLSLFLLVFFACQIPTAIEIRGTPSVRFAETVDIGKKFTDLLTEAISRDDRLTIIPCDKPEVITYLIHANLINKGFNKVETREEFENLYENFPEMTLIYDQVNDTPLLDEETLIYKTDDPVLLPLSELGSVLDNFRFYDGEEGYKTILYFSGSKLVEKAKIRIIINDIEGEEGAEVYTPIGAIDTAEEDDVDNEGSDIETWKVSGYDEEVCPSGGLKIAIPLTGRDIALSFQVYIPQGKSLSLSDFEAGSINVEVVVWLPFMFEAGEGAELSFPDGSFFSSEDDLFGRDEPDSESLITSIIESLSVGVKFENSPFNGAKLIIESGNILIPYPIENDTLSFTLTEENMEAINDPENWPFKPNIKIGFGDGNILSFKKSFRAIEFSFKAKIRYRKDFY